ncbi:hypothetical protein B484DRAFT_462374, partial [Ochromonadaceae sp. CCMP2298]
FAGQPAAFDVVTRALRHELPRTLKGEGDGYVDDFYGLGLDAEIPEDMRSIMALIRQLLGDKAIAEDKSAFGKRLEIIGWLFDLLQQLVTIGQRCLDKALHGFMAVNEFKPIKLKELQRMASWGVRYGTINCLMHPFTSVLFNETRGKTNPFCALTLSPLGRRAVQMMRILTLMIAVDEPAFARPFASWESSPSSTPRSPGLALYGTLPQPTAPNAQWGAPRWTYGPWTSARTLRTRTSRSTSLLSRLFAELTFYAAKASSWTDNAPAEFGCAETAKRRFPGWRKGG